MLSFELIRWKNLLSTGNVFTEIKLNDTPNALIIGENGAGKSTILDALTFSLFGKPFRKINKPGLVNSVNGKNCLVEVEFSSNNKKYKVIRGIKPNIFEIWCDDICLNQDSASKDYQEHLEKFILRMNYKSFTQIVILGSASFTPFMQLTPADRRAVIEDLLDIQVFSTMNDIVKARLQENKDLLERNRIELYGKEEKKDVIERNIISSRKNSQEELDKLTLEMDDYYFKIEELQRELTSLRVDERTIASEVEEVSRTTSPKMYKEYLSLHSKLDAKRKHLDNHVNFLYNHDDCPTCNQSIGEEFKTGEIENSKGKFAEIDDAIAKLELKISNWDRRNAQLEKLTGKLSDARNAIHFKEKDIASCNMMINSIKNRMPVGENTDGKAELENVLQEIETLNQHRQNLVTTKQYIETAISLLKDGGIKTRIIKQYLPVINQKINKYLLQMGFMCNFNLDENFIETIKSRYRDDFSYQNFSEGEKTRINLSILFAWRDVARMRNSVNTNLLIFDEILDSSLDSSGTDEFLKLIKNVIIGTDTFIISHKKDQIIDKFEKVYLFEKKRNFSILKDTI